MYMQAAMSNLCRHLCDLDLASGEYDLFLNHIGSGWTWRNDAHTEYGLTGPFATSMEIRNYPMAERYLTSFLRVRGRQMHDEAIELGLGVVANDINQCCRLADIGLERTLLGNGAHMQALLEDLKYITEAM
jgi:hypothetical protein